MLDSSEGVCAGQTLFEYLATSVLFSMYRYRTVTGAEGVDLPPMLGPKASLASTW
jgi:hypothetical protein